jgi:hypothetical protein
MHTKYQGSKLKMKNPCYHDEGMRIVSEVLT